MNKEIERRERRDHWEMHFIRMDCEDSMREPATSYSEGEEALEELYDREGR